MPSSPPSCDGLDIHGQYQPITDEALVPQFALMSVKATEGAHTWQVQGAERFMWFRRRGFRYRGLYHWLRADSTAAEQVQNLANFIKALGGLQQGELVQLDWERTPGLPMPTDQLVLEWCRLAQQLWPGRIIVYVSDWVEHFHEWLATDPIESVWYANYNTDHANPAGGWQECAMYHAAIWQYTSSYICPGIGKVCDANHVFDWTALDALAGYAPSDAVPIPLPTPPHIPTEDNMLIYKKAGKSAQWLSDGRSRFHLADQGQALRAAQRYSLTGLVALDAGADLNSIGEVVGADPGDV